MLLWNLAQALSVGVWRGDGHHGAWHFHTRAEGFGSFIPGHQQCCYGVEIDLLLEEGNQGSPFLQGILQVIQNVCILVQGQVGFLPRVWLLPLPEVQDQQVG